MKHTWQPDQKNNQQGFTLVEMALLILVLGLIVRGVLSFIQPQTEQQKYQITVERQHKIAAALSGYAQKYGSLPCPGRPDPTTPRGESWPGPCNVTPGWYPFTINSGVIPFKVLGLQEADIIDGYGQPFTYFVNLDVALDPTTRTDVFENCRTSVGTIWNTGAANVNGAKATFCCGNLTATGSDLIRIYSDAAKTQLISPTRDVSAMTAANRDSVPAAAAITGPNAVMDYVAYVLVSHGQNKASSYMWGNQWRMGNINGNTAMGATDPSEIENADDDRDFIDMPPRESATEHFDDILLWRTQNQVMAEFGNNSCERP